MATLVRHWEEYMNLLTSYGICLIAAILAAVTSAQQTGTRTVQDPGNASVTGRIALPSGEFAGKNIKVTLTKMGTPVMSSYTDKDGRYTIANLHAGEYVVEVTGDEKRFERVSETVRLGYGERRGVSLFLREKQLFREKGGSGVTSAAETDVNVPAAARTEYERGTKLVRQGKLDRAIEHFERAIALHPGYEAAHNDLGVQYLKLKRFDSAAEQFKAALAINARAFNPRLNLGITLVDQKQYAVAIDQLNQALAIDRGSPAACLYMGIARTELDDLQAAYADLSKALILGGPAFSTAHYYLGKVHLKRDERDEALKSLKAYLEAMPRGELAESAKTLVKRLE
jgi:tetratricopeptide (TPR) repeat protein